MSFDLKEAFLIFIRGVLMGSADIVPGVSGGTIALITGIYGHLVEAISNIKFGFIKPLLKGDGRGFINGILEEIDFKFFIPLVLGIGVAFLTLAKVVTYCMDVHTALTYSFFLGLIIASAVILFKKLNEINLTNIIFAVIGAILTYILYEYMLTALHELHFAEIITFVVGALIGILGFSKILNYLLKNHEHVTMAFLIGVMLGSLKVPAVEIMESTGLNFAGLFPCLIVAVIGFALIIILETKFDYIE